MDLADWLLTQNITLANGQALTGSGAAINLFAGDMPDSPDECVALYEAPGGSEGVVMMGGTRPIENPRVQVVARAAKDGFIASRTNIQTLYTKMDGKHGITMGSTLYEWMVAEAPPQDAGGRDQNGRPLHTFVVNIKKAVG